MDSKKMKIIIAISIVINVILIIVMMTLKQGYMEQAQSVVASSTKAYTDQVAKVVNSQNEFIAKSNAIWQLIFESLQSGDKSQTAFKARLAAIDTAKILQVTEVSGNVQIACGEGCNVSFVFAGGNLKSVDYSALASLAPEQEYTLTAPPAFQFQAK